MSDPRPARPAVDATRRWSGGLATAVVAAPIAPAVGSPVTGAAASASRPGARPGAAW
ncbi:hypothetical protein PHY01_27390 [Pseudonocardia hydrocarbonoxydans]|uniref:Uncharacterized protein n=1 Tax=Pseudonocardia hydrocarbonoxydans TaxID=76726 RepID=A0A4Y3WSX9_9PSEU|nr:hypothetical protein [Pseudonocardia hydrocarbonoxydans]GEC20456.1 hypothetical protein PHY01_27390 [Pseudonocardia hydrocarbonoxydans]